MSYNKTIELEDDEVAAKINVRDGKVTKIINKRNNIPIDKELHNSNESFYKGYIKADEVLLKLLTPAEYRVVGIMKMRSKINTNSLEPLNDETTITELSKLLEVHRNYVSKIIDKLRELGVFASFEVTNQYGQRIKSWILNPSISFKGRIISKEIVHLFSDTMITKLVKPS